LDVFHNVDGLKYIVFPVLLLKLAPLDRMGSGTLHTAAFSSSKMIDALWPLGVPKVRSSIPDFPIRPVGLSEEDIARVVKAKCFEV